MAYQPSEETFEEIYTLLSERLNRTGDIRPNDAWMICKGRTYRGYSTIIQVFTLIMKTMIEQGKAVKVRTGLYQILKPNTRT